jgi:hypothetical protein
MPNTQKVSTAKTLMSSSLEFYKKKLGIKWFDKKRTSDVLTLVRAGPLRLASRMRQKRFFFCGHPLRQPDLIAPKLLFSLASAQNEAEDFVS